MAALVTGLLLLILFPVSLGTVLGALAIIAVMVGALVPDLDQPTANIWHRLLGSNTLGNVFQFFSGGHRHLTHSLIGIVAIGALLRAGVLHLINPQYTSHAFTLLYAFMIGYLSHPVVDTFTDQGVPWFWPLRLNIKIPPGPEEMRITTNSFVELVIIRGGLIAVAVLLLQSHWSVFRNLFT